MWFGLGNQKFLSKETKMSISLGNWGEDIAVDFLKDKDFQILVRNYRRQRAEIDIIAQNDEVIAFVEVKTRSNDKFGSGLEAITINKQRQIIKAAKIFCQENDIYDIPCRFDVISIKKDKKNYHIEHIENAFIIEE